MNTYKEEFKETLPKEATHFVIITVAKNLEPIAVTETVQTKEENLTKFKKEGLIRKWSGEFGEKQIVINITSNDSIYG